MLFFDILYVHSGYMQKILLHKETSSIHFTCMEDVLYCDVLFISQS